MVASAAPPAIAGYVISLARRPDRRERFLQANSGKGVALQVFDAVDGRTVRRSDLVGRRIIADESLGFSSGAIGNALSHRRLWEVCVELGRPIMIFEDDAQLPDDFAAWVAPIVAEVEGNCDIFYAGYNRDAVVSIGYRGQWCNLAFEAPPGGYAAAVERHNHAAETNGRAIFDVRLAWGTLAYAVSPRGAGTLLGACFPMTDKVAVRMYGSGRNFTPDALDGIINVMVQRGAVRARTVFPPLVIGPNDKTDSDVVVGRQA